MMVRLGILTADLLLIHDENYIDWYSGLGTFGEVIYSLIRSQEPETVVEIGSAYGLSTCFIASALQRNKCGKLYSIDPHEKTNWNDGGYTTDTLKIVQGRLKDLYLSEYVEHIQLYSKDAIISWSRPIDLLFIDGSHTYEDVENDFWGFIPHIKLGGLVLFHDTIWESLRSSSEYRTDIGVPQVVQQLQDKGYPMITLPEHLGLTILQNSVGGFKLVDQPAVEEV